MFATERYLSAAVKSHSVSMAVRTSKDVAGGYWTAAGTRHCLIKQLALMRYNYPYLPTCITNIHKQHLYDGSEIRGLPGCANDSHQGLVGYQVISDLKIEALEKRQPTWIYHDVFTLIDRYSHCLPLWVNIPMLPGSQVAIPTQRQDHSFNRVQSRNSRGKKKNILEQVEHQDWSAKMDQFHRPVQTNMVFHSSQPIFFAIKPPKKNLRTRPITSAARKLQTQQNQDISLQLIFDFKKIV